LKKLQANAPLVALIDKAIERHTDRHVTGCRRREDLVREIGAAVAKPSRPRAPGVRKVSRLRREKSLKTVSGSHDFVAGRVALPPIPTAIRRVAVAKGGIILRHTGIDIRACS